MQTQCPSCQTVFRLTEAHLNIAQGNVRCGHCRKIFDAHKNLMKSPVTPPLPLSPQSTAAVKPVKQSRDHSEELELTEDDFPEVLEEDVAALRHRTSWRTLLFWFLFAVAMTALLLTQTIWFWQRDVILQHPQIRPWLDSFCYTFLCTLPLTRDVESFHTQQHLVRPHPSLPEVIEVQLVFSNDAIFPQPYPEVQLTFQDSNEQPIAQRHFKPSEYLPSTDLNKMMRPSATAHIKLDLKSMTGIIIEDKIVAGYTFEFL